MHKQSFAECHSLAIQKPHWLAHPCIFRLKFPKFQKNSWSFQLKPQEFKQKPQGFQL